MLHSWSSRQCRCWPLRLCRRLLFKRLQTLPRRTVRAASMCVLLRRWTIDVRNFFGYSWLSAVQIEVHECTFHTSCFKFRNAGEVQMSSFGHMEPVAILAWHLQGRCVETWRQTFEVASGDCRRAACSDDGEPSLPECQYKCITIAFCDATRFRKFFVSARP